MTPERFKDIVNEQFTLCCDLLRVKEIDYSDGKDRLIQFKTAAKLSNCSPIESLRGMMAKHTTKFYQMLNEMRDEGKCFDAAQWDEVLSDHINYHFLLRALLHEIGEPDFELDQKEEKSF